MSQEMIVLVSTAALLGFFHTLLGPDPYLPLIVMGKARQWPMAKTTWMTLFAGIGHVASSVLLGLIGITLGMAVTKLVANVSTNLFFLWRNPHDPFFAFNH